MGRASRWSTILGFGALIALSLATGCTKNYKTYIVAPGTDASGHGAIHGTVAGIDWQPIGGAHITADALLAPATSDSVGEFIYNDVPAPRVYRLTVSGAGYVPLTQSIDLNDGEVYRLQVFLARTDTLRVLRSATSTDGTEDIVVQDSLAYLSTTAGLDIRDVHAASFGALLGHVDAQSYYFHKLAVANGYAYIATGFSTLIAVDVHNPADPFAVDSMEVGGKANGVAVDGNILAVAADDSLLFVDVSQPTHLVRVGGVATALDGLGQGCYGVALDHGRHIAVVSSFNNGIELVRYNNPGAPDYVTAVANHTNPLDADLDLVRGYAAVAGDDGVTILDYSDPTNPQELAVYTPGGNGGRTARWFGDRVLFASSFNGLYMVDFSTVTAPRLISLLRSPAIGSAYGLARDGTNVWLAGVTRMALIHVPLPVAVPVTSFARVTRMRAPAASVVRP
jgi:hypothetical protein